ncbi:MAG: hypothetical protein VW450_00540 [Chloroflexota bacterium]
MDSARVPVVSGRVRGWARWLGNADHLAALYTLGLAALAVVAGLLMLAGVIHVEGSAYSGARDYYLSLAKGDLKGARARLSPQAQAVVDAAGPAGWALTLPAGVQASAIEEVESLGITLTSNGRRANVGLVLDGAPPEKGAGRALLDIVREDLVRVDGRWLLLCPGRLECAGP